MNKTEASVVEDAGAQLIQDEPLDEPKYGYLSHMITNVSSKGLLPAYSSWSLTCIGTYASYSPSTGTNAARLSC